MFSEIRIPRGIPCVVRCDGRNFHRLTEELGFLKPYDVRFMKIMVKSARSVFDEGFNPVVAYVFSDEINFLFFELPFSGRVEKIDSVIAAIVSSSFSLNLLESMGIRKAVSFDARVILLPRDRVVEYFAWRQSECWRNHINSYAFYTLLRAGYDRREAAKMLKGLKGPELHDLVFKISGINLARTPIWQRRGVLLHHVCVRKEGVDRSSGKRITFTRRVLVENWSIPSFSSPVGRSFLEKLITCFQK